MKKNKTSKNWLTKQHRDIYVKKSKIDGYRSRSAYKLIEIENKFNIFKNTKTFLDLGSYPGGWTQVAKEKIRSGKILSVDLKKMQLIDGTDFILGDFLIPETKLKIINFFKNRVDIIVSDMATNTTGNKTLDVINTGELCLQAMEFSKDLFKKDCVFVSKIFMGSNFNEIIKYAKKIFKIVKINKPESSRKESKENYIVCRNLN